VWTWHYGDAGQFGAVPIFALFNYNHGQKWGAEAAIEYGANNVDGIFNTGLRSGFANLQSLTLNGERP
jgi:hypothetical protein